MGLDHAVSTSRMVEGVHPRRRRAREPIGDGKNAAQIVRRMAPLGSKPGIVEIEPADHRANIESRLDGVELEEVPGTLGAIGHDGAGTIGPSSLLQAG